MKLIVFIKNLFIGRSSFENNDERILSEVKRGSGSEERLGEVLEGVFDFLRYKNLSKIIFYILGIVFFVYLSVFFIDKLKTKDMNLISDEFKKSPEISLTVEIEKVENGAIYLKYVDDLGISDLPYIISYRDEFLIKKGNYHKIKIKKGIFRYNVLSLESL